MDKNQPQPPQENAYKLIIQGSNFLTIRLNHRGWYRFQTRQGPPWGMGAPFSKPGPNFWVQISNFLDILGVLRVRLAWDMCSNIHLGPMDHYQPLLDLIFIIFWNLIIFPLFLSMDIRGALGQPQGGFSPFFRFKGPKYNWVKGFQSLTDPKKGP